MPCERAGVRVKRVNAVMFSSYDHQIALTREIASANVRGIQWLGIYLTVDWKIELKPKRTRVNVARRQRDIVWIPTGPRIVVVVGQNISGVACVDEANK